MKLYLAGPLGFSEAGTWYQNHVLIPRLTGMGLEVVSPWTLTDERIVSAVLAMAYGDAKRAAWQKLNPQIAERNCAAIDECPAILAILDGTDVDSGTAAEIGYAYAKGKRIWGYRGDFRLSSDNEGSEINLQVEFFIKNSGGAIFKTLDDLVAGLTAAVGSARE